MIDFGLRLQAAKVNRPLNFNEFQARMPQTIYVSATPGKWELQRSKINYEKLKTVETRYLMLGSHNLQPIICNSSYSPIVEQLIRPTGFLDPKISVRPTENQIPDLLQEVEKRVQKGQRILITTLTKRMAEDLSVYLKERSQITKQSIKSMYLHSDINTLERTDILEDLRKGKYDVLVGINLLREGLDLPEVSLVAILDADKESFLRSETSLIQVMGRAARHEEGYVIMYADEITKSMRKAISEVNRRRRIQHRYNIEHNIEPRSIEKTIRPKLINNTEAKRMKQELRKSHLSQDSQFDADLKTIQEHWIEFLPDQKKKTINKLKRQMRQAAKD